MKLLLIAFVVVLIGLYVAHWSSLP